MSQSPPKTEEEQWEKIPTKLFKDSDEACRLLAKEIASLIRKRQDQGRSVVLGLATGSTPVGLYRELIRLHQEDALSFRNVVTFNLDEYFPIQRNHRESYYYFMREQLFRHIDIPQKQIHIPDGNIPREKVYRHCQDYEAAIEKAGGLDLQILGIGRTGHIGFNEPGARADSLTRLVRLDTLTRKDAARDFLGLDNVPLFGISMGVGTILKARRVVLMAWGRGKADVIQEAIEGDITSRIPASFLQNHEDVSFYLDEPAASRLTRRRYPWLCGPLDWTPELTRRAVIWLCKRVQKPILKLIEDDYSEHGLEHLVMEAGSAYNLNIRIFNEIQHTITGWPGGKPNADDSTRPERAEPHPKRVLVFAPEPMDDVAGMGGTLHRLQNQGHQVKVAYMTSGNLAVPDEKAGFTVELLLKALTASASGGTDTILDVKNSLENKNEFEEDPAVVRAFKSLIRESEARASLRHCRLQEDCATFLNLDFYERGRYRHFKPTEADLKIILTLLESYQPHQVYLTGDQADPQSLAGVCHRLVRRALNQVSEREWYAGCYLWLFRSGAEEWTLENTHMAVPLSPDELDFKINAIYQHESQRSQTPVDFEDHREFWQQVEAINRLMAEQYDRLGLAEYEAIEVFQRLQG